MFSPSHRQRHSFVLQLVQFFLNLFCLCNFYSRIYDTVSYQLESNSSWIRRWTSSFLKPTALNKVHFPFSLALDRVSSQEIWQIMHNSQLLTVRLFFDSEWANFTGLHISKNESDIVWLAISDKLKWPHRYKNWYKTILNSTQNKKKVYNKTNLNNNIKLQVFRTIYTGRNFFRNISCLFRSVLKC
jgi:hypothetical protein